MAVRWMPGLVLEATITCPHCGFARQESMPAEACVHFYECAGCHAVLRPKPGECCVFCSWGSSRCPPKQREARAARRERALHRLFDLGVIIKGIDGALEVAGGVAFLLVKPGTLSALVAFLTAHEISEDPADLVANLLRHGAQQLTSSTTLFAGAYLLVHGLAKLFLVAGLLRGRLWAYPAALWFLTAFVLYQAYRLVLTLSFGLAVLTGFDLVVMFLIWHEYRFRKQAGLTSG